MIVDDLMHVYGLAFIYMPCFLFNFSLLRLGHAIAHAVVCAVEARFHKGRKHCNTPKSIWRLSVKSLIQTMATRTNQEEGDWSIESIDKAISTCGIGLACDEDHPRQVMVIPVLLILHLITMSHHFMTFFFSFFC